MGERPTILDSHSDIIMYQRRLQIPLTSSLLMVLYTEISELFCTSFRLALVSKILLRTSICQLNCRGLLSKFLDIEQLILNEWQSQVVCLCETWLHSCSTTDSFLSIDGYTLFRRDRPHNHHGGLLVYVNPNLRPWRRPDLKHTDIECITLELHARSFGTFFLFFCYCPPNFPPLTFFPLRSERLEQATNFPTFLLGNFNAKHPLWNTGPSNTAQAPTSGTFCWSTA